MRELPPQVATSEVWRGLLQKLPETTLFDAAESEARMAADARTFRNLEAWQRGMDLVVEVYKFTAKLPSSERFGLCAQMQRASVSVPANVAEGHERKGNGYVYHLRVALGSLAELDTQLEAALRLGFVRASDAGGLKMAIERVGQLIHGLRRSIRRRLVAESSE